MEERSEMEGCRGIIAIKSLAAIIYSTGGKNRITQRRGSRWLETGELLPDKMFMTQEKHTRKKADGEMAAKKWCV